MTISTIGINGALPQHILDLKSRIEELQVQLGSGRRGQTFGGLGASRALSLDMRGEIARIESFMTTISMVELRLEIMNGALESAHELVNELQGAWLVAPYEVGTDGKTQIQHTAEAGLSQLVQLLNSKSLDRYLFAGRDNASPPVAPDKAILEGDGARAGLAQVVAERALADLGADGLGRLSIPAAAGATVSVSEDGAGHPFGFKLAGVSSTLSGTTVAGPTGSPPAIDVTFSSSLPNVGDEIAISLALPDGTTAEVRLTATGSATPGAGEFTIGADENATAANFETALRAETARVAAIDLRAASAVRAADQFFDFDSTTPPQRVAGPPFETATTLVDATTANTVFWYEGDLTTPPRDSTVARVDEGYTIAYGARADEAALKNAIKQFALVAVSRFDEQVASDSLRYAASRERGLPAVAGAPGYPRISEIATGLANRHVAVQAVKDRHREALAFARGTLDAAEGVDQEEIAVQFLRLQTQLQASYETTSILARLTLANFL